MNNFHLLIYMLYNLILFGLTTVCLLRAESDTIVRKWQEKPNELENLELGVHHIHEDRQNRPWFVCRDSLSLYENNNWENYPFPIDHLSSYLSRDAVCMLSIGRYLFLAGIFNNLISNHFKALSFDPILKKFDLIQHPDDRLITFVALKNDGKVWIVSKQYCSSNNLRIEIFDGKAFQSVPGLENIICSWISKFCFYEHSNGQVWFGGLKWKGYLENSKFNDVSIQNTEEHSGLHGILELIDGRTWFCSSRIEEKPILTSMNPIHRK